jgi:DNA-binding NtrC family response regulator
MATTIQNPSAQPITSTMFTADLPQVPNDDAKRLRSLLRSGLSNLDRVSLEDIILRAYRLGSEQCHRAMAAVQAEKEPLKLSEVERRAVVRAFSASRGVANTMAKLLGIGRSSVYRKIRRHGLVTHQPEHCPNCGCSLRATVRH